MEGGGRETGEEAQMGALLGGIRRPVKVLYQLKSSVQGEESPAHTLDRRPPRISHLHVATATPPASLPSTPVATVPTCLLSHQNSPADALPPTPTSPPHPAQTSLRLFSLRLFSLHLAPPFAFLIPYSKSISFHPRKNSGMHPCAHGRLAGTEERGESEEE